MDGFIFYSLYVVLILQKNCTTVTSVLGLTLLCAAVQLGADGLPDLLVGTCCEGPWLRGLRVQALWLVDLP